ncbi:hypothetical protein J437_LFUL008755 [Ladona fulva]|uniref:Uncharacterized protein n=1 Tax=Ladona fulva TaxID=123851 RepID=A0A8K0K422_LADFU|nr:hypothetical protein J437_LFUL008755 [Ladona fulva]
MGSPNTDNVLADIEKSIVDDDHDGFIIGDGEYQVIDSFEIGDVDDIHASDASYSQLLRERRKPSYNRRRKDEFSRNDYRRSHPTKYRRSPRRSTSKVSDHRHSPRKSRERRTIERNSVDQIRVSVKNSPLKVDKLPDLKCTTSLETGKVSVVLLSENTNKCSNEDDKEKETCDSGKKRAPTLVKNPFACASLRRKVSSSPEKGKMRQIEVPPRINLERCSSERNYTERNSLERRSMGRRSIEKYRLESGESRSYDSRNRDRSFSPVRSRSSRRSSPFFDHGRARRRSSSRNSERYRRRRRRSRDHRRSRESSRKRSRSRGSSNLSRVSSRSSLSFMSIRGHSPNDHDRKSSPLRPNNCYGGQRQNNENYFSNSEDFNHELSLLLSERKHKQLTGNESGAPLSSNYNNSTWKYENWTNAGSGIYPQSQDAGVNYSGDVVVKPYDQQQPVHLGYSQDQYNQVVKPYDQQQPVHLGYSQDQYNQACYNNNVSQNYPSMYAGNTENSGQFSYNYGNPYPDQIPNQYYPQSSTAINFPSTSYTDQTSAAQYPPMAPPEEPVIVNCVPQHTSNVSQQQYALQEQSNYVPINPLPIVDTQPSAFAEASQNEHYGSSNCVPNIVTDTAPSELPQKIEESDEEEAPPPPVISNTWREIESVEENSWKGADKKWSVLGKCEALLKKLMSNDPSMECFKFPELMQFSIQGEAKISQSSNSRSSVRAARRLVKTLRFQSPLLRKRNNPHLKFEPWKPEG